MESSISEIISKLTDAQVIGISFGAGLLSHAWFKSFEPTVWSFLRFLLVLSVAFIYSLSSFTTRSPLSIAVLYAAASVVYLTTLSASIACYRLVWHPLRHIPGPKSAALWKIWALRSSQKGRLAYDTDELHKKYGPVVRVGPNCVDFQNAATIPRIYGATPSQTRKGSWYDFSGDAEGYNSLQFEKDDALHAARRKIWDQGFSIKALAGYEADIKNRTYQLSEGIARVSRESPTNEVDIELWSSFFSFEVMGDLGFGEGFNMLETGKPHMILEVMKESLRLGIPLAQIPWVSLILHQIPKKKVDKEFKEFCESQVAKRIQAGTKRADLFSVFLGEAGDPTKKLSKKHLDSDAILTIIAGSDTTSSVLTWCWYYLLSTRDRYYYKKLQAELDAASSEVELDISALARLPWLNAIINEAMRLQPPVPGGLQRYAPKGGIVLDGVYVPEGTTIACGAYTVQRDPKNWSPSPEKFRPERWIDSDKEEAANKQAFIPFSFGPRSCPGKSLAYIECRLVLSTLIPQYDAELKPGFDCAAFEAGVIDVFTIQTPSFPIIMNPRKR